MGYRRKHFIGKDKVHDNTRRFVAGDRMSWFGYNLAGLYVNICESILEKRIKT